MATSDNDDYKALARIFAAVMEWLEYKEIDHVPVFSWPEFPQEAVRWWGLWQALQRERRDKLRQQAARKLTEDEKWACGL